MKKLYLLFLLVFNLFKAQNYQYDYETVVTFPAGYSVGDYVEFVQTAPIAANASGYYEISIAYTRGNIAAAATFISASTHASPSIWREVGIVNANDYATYKHRNFVIDANGGLKRFRIRAINTLGVASNLPVSIRIRSINFNSSFTTLNTTGNDTTVTKLQPMTYEWNLFVGNIDYQESAKIAIKAISNGNVGIGVSNPQNKLDVNGTVHAKEVKVDMNGWADFVFAKDYRLMPLEEVQKHISEKGHLPNIPSAEEVVEKGINLGEMNAKLLEKIEELTLYSIEQNKQIQELKKENASLKQHQSSILNLEKRILELEKYIR